MPSTEQLVSALRDSALRLGRMSEKMDAPWSSTVTDPRELHNMYIRGLVTAYAAKFSQLLNALLHAVEQRHFLAYALNGRALLETTATLRYFVLYQYKPILDKPTLTQSDIESLIQIDDRHLRGGRFDWESFLLGRYAQLQVEVEKQLAASKAKQKHVVEGIIAEQINVLTCIEKWAKTTPSVLTTYNLFCELVHPNIGSTFLVASTGEKGMHFSPTKGRSVGEAIFRQSMPFLVACTLQPFGQHLELLMAAIWHADQL